MQHQDLIIDKEAGRFYLDTPNPRPYLDYRLKDGIYHLDYAFVPLQLRGRGMGGILVDTVLSFIEKQEAEAMAHCGFVKAHINKDDRWYHIISGWST